jgi:GT2 family glycosyltransferase
MIPRLIELGDRLDESGRRILSAPSHPAWLRAIPCVVAIPVRDEAERLPRCLRALAAQERDCGRLYRDGDLRVVIFANNCTDGSAEIARSLAQSLSLSLRIVECALPATRAHAGNARRGAMDIAERWLAECGQSKGVILTTDADSYVPPNWLANNLAAITSGADAVLGQITLDEDGDRLPDALHRRGSLEDAYGKLLAEIAALLDPLESNPWPHHATVSGASLAVTVEAYRRIGGLPRVPLGEDKAFVEELLRRDAKVRFSPDVHVVTSGRVDGRAPGGVADTLLLRSIDPGAFCDETLEPFRTAIKRASWRGRLRRLRGCGAMAKIGELVATMGLSACYARRILGASSFGAAWSMVEAASPSLQRRLLTPADLPGQIRRAGRVLVRLKCAPSNAAHNIETESLVALAPHDPRGGARARDEELSSLIAG